jgi:hypothetical protein
MLTLACALAALLVLALLTPDERAIAAPALASITLVVWLWDTIRARDRAVPFVDVGFFCALATTVYTVYPLVNYWAGGLEFGVLSDARLQSYHIAPAELGAFHVRHVAYLFSFVIAYLAVRGYGQTRAGGVEPPAPVDRVTIVGGFLLLVTYFVVLQALTGVQVYVSYEADAFAANVRASTSLPLFFAQLSDRFAGFRFVFGLGLVALIVNRCDRVGWRILLYLYLGGLVAYTIALRGSRTDMVLSLMAAGLFYHRMVRRLSARFLFASGLALFALFILLGLYRTYMDLTELRLGVGSVDGGVLTGVNEFDSLLGTSYDVLQRTRTGLETPWYLALHELMALLPPQQLMPFEKVTGSDWYLRVLGLEGTGVGLMWGVVTQAIVGFGIAELVLRGVALGLVAALVHRWYVKRQQGFYETVLYAYLCVRAYYTFRDSTFGITANLVWEVLPCYLAIRLVRAVSVRVGSATAEGGGPVTPLPSPLPADGIA